jgi:geranylgeranyl diphosphate synthase type II
VDLEFDLKRYLSDKKNEVDFALERMLPPPEAHPARLHEAMRYSVFAGGKRLRPILTLAAAEACGGDPAEAIPAACAVECLHTYSLVHDDLPCMDDDDLRRGKPTCHKVYGEGMAVLAGDALLTISFDMLAQSKGWPRYEHDVLIRELAGAAGSLRLIGGQAADLEGEGQHKQLTPEELIYIHESKTSALITTCVRLGAMSAGADAEMLEYMSVFGRDLGLAFQIIDDILDVTQTTEKLGKSAGKDEAAHKTTWPAVFGLEASREKAAELTGSALSALSPFGPMAEPLRAIGKYLLERDY